MHRSHVAVAGQVLVFFRTVGSYRVNLWHLAYGSCACTANGSKNLAVLPNGHDINLLFAANRNKDSAKVALALVIVNFRIPSLI